MGWLATFLIQLLVGVALQVVGYLLLPKSSSNSKEEFDPMEDPTAEAGRPIPVVFGKIWVEDVNILWFGDKATTTREVDA